MLLLLLLHILASSRRILNPYRYHAATRQSTTSLAVYAASGGAQFGFEDVLSAQDVEDYRRRFDALSALFPGVSDDDLRALVGVSPLLLVIGTDDFRVARDRMVRELPYVDPSYAVSLRSAGLDLLVSFMAPTFDLEARMGLVARYVPPRSSQAPAFVRASTSHAPIREVGPGRNLTEFIRRVPHALTPRYLLALREYCTAMQVRPQHPDCKRRPLKSIHRPPRPCLPHRRCSEWTAPRRVISPKPGRASSASTCAAPWRARAPPWSAHSCWTTTAGQVRPEGASALFGLDTDALMHPPTHPPSTAA